jgi:hypothetical protein
MDRIILRRGEKVTVTFDKVSAVYNPSKVYARAIMISEVDSDKVFVKLQGTHRARVDGSLDFYQDFADVITLPVYYVEPEEYDDPQPVDFTTLTLYPDEVKELEFQIQVMLSRITKVRADSYEVSRTGGDGSWIPVHGRKIIVAEGKVFFRTIKSKVIELNVTDSVRTTDRKDTIEDFSQNFGSDIGGGGTPITGIEYDDDTGEMVTETALGEERFSLPLIKEGELKDFNKITLTKNNDDEIEIDVLELTTGLVDFISMSDVGATAVDTASLEDLETYVGTLPRLGTYYYTGTDAQTDDVLMVVNRGSDKTKAHFVNKRRTITYDESEL